MAYGISMLPVMVMVMVITLHAEHFPNQSRFHCRGFLWEIPYGYGMQTTHGGFAVIPYIHGERIETS
eukprot:6173466-Pleurochrysis_carterae.AAC.1